MFRIGVNLGDIIIEGNDTHGDGVSVAARLEALAEPSGVCISRAARDQIRDKLNVSLTDLGEIEVKNIARPVRAFALSGAAVSPPPKTKPKSKSLSRTPMMVASALAALMVIGVAVWATWNMGDSASVDDMAFALPDRPSLAVLPFVARGGDEAATLLAEAVAEDVTAKLAQVSGLFVISSASTFVYRDRKASAKAVAEELDVRNIITGVVRPVADGLSVSIEIADAISGRSVLSGTFSGADTALFELEDDISAAIALELVANISRTATASQTTNSTEAYLLWNRGSRYYSIGPTLKTLRRRPRCHGRLCPSIPISIAPGRCWLMRAGSKGISILLKIATSPLPKATPSRAKRRLPVTTGTSWRFSASPR